MSRTLFERRTALRLRDDLLKGPSGEIEGLKGAQAEDIRRRNFFTQKDHIWVGD